MSARPLPPPPAPELVRPDGSARHETVDPGVLGPLGPLFALADVTDVMVNGPGPVWIERAGRMVRTGITLDRPALDHLVERLVGPLGRRVDRLSPVVDARLPDGSRLHVVAAPLAIDGPCITIRRFRATAIPLAAFAPADVRQVLEAAVTGRANVVVSGGTGSGKTTMLNALLNATDPADRIVTIEDSAELSPAAVHVVRLEARPATVDGPPPVTIRDLVRASLRMRPDRIIVGEVRGPEALDMVQAMNTGHEGSLSTCHANGPDDALRRLELMIMTAELGIPHAAVRAAVHRAVDLLVHLERAADGARRVVAVAEPDTEGAETRLVADPGGCVGEPRRPWIGSAPADAIRGAA